MAFEQALSLTDDLGRRSEWKGPLLAVLLTLIAGGAMPFLDHYFRFSTWAVWAFIALIVLWHTREDSLVVLVRPIVPYLAWLFCFVTWGLIVAPVPDIVGGLKVLITTLVLAAGMAVVVSRADYLRQFANAMQWAMLINLMLLPLAHYTSRVTELLNVVAYLAEGFEPGTSRFAGLWGNPNMAGYVCLVVIILSVWANPLLAWMGRLCAVPMVYFTASRKSMLLLLLILGLHVLLVQRHNFKRLLVFSALGACAITLLLLGQGALRKTQARVAALPTVTRLIDITERSTAQAGGETRLDLLMNWLPVVKAAPWYGHGFGAMLGGADASRAIPRRNLLPIGTHNTYLGILLEVGPIGLIAFLLILVHYSRRYLTFRGSHATRWALVSFLSCNLVILFLSHSHLFDVEGKAAFCLFFLLPASRALKRQETAFQEG